MKEARIECLCKSYRVSDLRAGTVLLKGEHLWLSKAEFDASKSLAHAKKVGAVRVDWRERCQREKPRPTRSAHRKIVRPPPPVPSATMGPQEPSGGTGESEGSVVLEAVQEALEEALEVVPPVLETPAEDEVETQPEESAEPELPANVPPTEHECPICDKVCKTKRGLSMHMRTHVED